MNRVVDWHVGIAVEERFAGSLIGQCLGDALGLVVEGRPPEVSRRYVEETLRAGRVPEPGGVMAFGQYSDDSQLARELLQSYVALERFDPEDYARRIAAIFGEGRIVGFGQSTLEAARRLMMGVPWQESGTPPPAAGNGSAMRAGPVGLVFKDDPRGLLRAARDQGVITHQDARCSAGAVAVAGAVALALRREEIQTDAFTDQLAEWTAEIEPSFAARLKELPDLVPLSPEKAAERIVQAGLETGAPPRGIPAFVVGSVLWSLYSFLKNVDDYRETVYTAISAGGDTDTTAAMAGAISGARLGLDAVPADLARQLTDNGTWGYRDLRNLAYQAHASTLRN